MDLTVREAAALLHVSENAVYRWIHGGTLPSCRVHDRYRLNRVALLEWATARNLPISPEIFRDIAAPSATSLLAEAIRTGGVIHDVAGEDKPAALRAVCEALPLPANVDRKALYGVLLAREALGSTAIGNGIAIPHPRSPLILGVRRSSVTVVFLKHPIDFGALDGRPVGVLFTLISTTIRVHLQLLSHLMGALKEERFVRQLAARASREDIVATLERIEAAFAAGGGREGATG